MQLPAGLDLPHTRARGVHWVTTAAALAAVAGGAILVQPSDATANAPASAAPGPDPSAAEYPLDCGPLPILVTDQVGVDFDGDGHAETVAAVRCDAGGGTPPSGLYVLTGADESGGAPRIAETLVDPAEGMTVDGLEAAGHEVSVRLFGYSSIDVPRSQPDLQRDVTWAWEDGRLRLSAETPAATSA
ncbi:hypothetical protein [Streptomyces sp. B6B3]|uniref:hypothetical protein n=1 Tax=Streptomyces sp. B6B3 TaxID=3153570 RepID=UPI00325DA6A3